MEPKPSRKSRGRGRSSPGPARPAESRFKESSGWPLWLFPGSVGLRSALLRRLETTRQVCCRLGRLAVLERGGTGVEVHPLPADSDGARKPKCIKLGRKMKIHSMDQGAEHLLILSSDGKPFEYNYSIEHARFQGILQEKIIIQITCGDYHSLALSKGGELFAWGQNLHGQLGIGEMCPSVPVPQIVEHLSGVPLLQISAGEAHSMALSMAGITYSWGKNDMGQLGLGHTQNEDSPCLIEALDNQKIEFVACGGSHTALLTQDGKLFTFGAGKCGQLGHNSKRNELKPRLVTELVGKRVTQIVCGRWHTLAYAAGLGKVFSFGSGKEGQLGSRGTQNQLIPRPMKLSPNGELKFESRTSEKELIMIAGGNQSILLWMDKKNSYVNLRRKIPTVNESTIKRWIADVGTKQWQNTKREIREIFTSSACLTGSFLRQRLAVEPTSVHLDLNIARSAFKELTQKDWITNTVVALRLLFEEENTPECFLQEPKFQKKYFVLREFETVIITCLRDNLLKNLPVHSPHKEALEIFLILPECPVMHACNNWESLVIPFADAIYKLSDQSSMVLEEYWTTLPEAAFSRVVQMVRSAVASRLRYWTESTESNHQVKVLLEVLKKLHRCYQIMEAGEFAKEARDLECSEASLIGFFVLLVTGSWDKGKDVVEESHSYDCEVNQTTCQVPEEEFVVDELLDWLNFYGEAYRQHCRKADMEASAEEQNPVSFSNFSFLFNTLTKIKLLYADSLLKIQEKRIQACIRLAGFMEGEESELAFVPTFNLTVRRNHLIEDVLNQLTQFENEDLRRELWVSFTGEIGFGFRGVMTEFFYCLFEEMTQPDYGLFTYPEEASCMWFPVKPKFEEKRYYFFGMLCGLSLFNCNVANLPFPLALFKKLLGQNPSLEDLKELSPVLGKSLQFLLDNESSDFEEIFYIHFNIHWDSNDVDLIPNGSCIIVNQTNKSDYISKCVNYIFNISVKEVYNEFQRGFYKVCNKEIIQCFRPGELKDAIVGNTDFDWETFEKNARYEQGYSSSHPTIVMFWEALHKLSPEEKKKFLGTDRTQIKNLKNVQITFLCPEHLNEKDPMQAQTSFCFLYLPKYSTMERVEEALQFAISNNRGFG